MNLFLWGALPYIAFTFLIVGTLVRFFYFERNWTTKSSQFLEKKQLRIANPLFHFGLLCVIGGHVVGVLIPKLGLLLLVLMTICIIKVRYIWVLLLVLFSS